MKLSVFLLLCSIGLAQATDSYAQKATVNLEMRNQTVKEVLDEIEEQSDFSFFFNIKHVDLHRRVSVVAKKSDIFKVLETVFAGTDVRYSVVDRKIILSTEKQGNLIAQQKEKKVMGVVKDEKGELVIGANVSVKGTTIGTITDIDGRFSLNVPENAILLISYIGYTDQEIKTENKTQIDILLEEDTQTLDEVVVVGYGTQKKVNLTGAVTAVSGKEMTKRPVANATTMLQGQVPGLRIVQSTGQPGNEGVSMKVRGVGTFSGSGASPLVLINGIPGDMAYLDPSMIESVSVLKDAASSAIYGARAANGVIMVTTKQGAEDGKVNISYHGNFASHVPSKMFDLITDSPEYMRLFNIAKTNSGQGGLYPEEEIEKYKNANGDERYPSFDWLDYIFNPAFVQNHNFNLAGTANKTTYNVALNYINQNGTLKTFNYKKYNLTADLTTQATKWMKVGFYANMMKGDRNYNGYSPSDALLSGISQAPTYMPWMPDDGSGVRKWAHKAYDFEVNNKSMPVILGEDLYHHTNNITDLNAQLWLEVNLAKGLTWHTKGAVRQNNEREDVWNGGFVSLYNYHTGNLSYNQGETGMSSKEFRTFYINLYTYLKYDFTIPNKAHNFSVMAGYSQETNTYQTLGAFRRDFVFDLPVIDAGLGAPNWSNEGKKEEWALMSGFFRVNYNFKDRYLLEANARYDGSSRLSPDGRWGLFPSFSAAWRLTEEEFMKDLNLFWLTNAKIRGSWGKLGNQEIGLYPYQAMISKVSTYTFDKSNISSAYFQTAYVNRNIKWEETTIADIGMDVQLLNHLNVTFDWYRKETDGILRKSQISNLLGMDAPIINNGTMQDKGIELAINWQDAVANGALKGLNYSVGGYFERSRNKLVNFGAVEMDSDKIREEGLPYNSYYMLDCIGIFATEEEVKNSPKQFNDNTLPGDLKYRDVNKDGVINNDDRMVIDGRYPGFEYGFNASASWKGFDLSLLMQGVGNKRFYINGWGVQPFMQGSSPTKDYVENMWTEENPYHAKHPRLYFADMGGVKNTRPNTYFLQNASYLRLKNLTFGYTLPHELTSKFAVQRLRFYFSGDNLLTFTKFKGLDPERGGDGIATEYPQNRICSVGVNIDF
ncbi:TonB-dependent receptor [Parabacteroides goldsteinii]|uniref:TonB-dependent receptor n=6 Tax=Parabacteroides goldsteinii TaxID=328812 RepID=UPI00256EB831|nr:TonB-dependent receptor [Parabacteroides goldsteinii]